MRFFQKYVFPALYGLLIYFTIRLLHDTDVNERFWERQFYVNAVEITYSIIIGYLEVYLFGKLFKYFDKRQLVQLNYRNVVRELAMVVATNLALVNVVFVPMNIALHGGWISIADIADINMIPTLYAIIYYGITRSTAWLNAYVGNKVLLEKVSSDHLRTELKFLRAQYHPHFLFNALNTIYFQMDEDVNGAKSSIEKFSELLRYQLYDQQQQVPVINELAYLQSFIDLQKIRTSSKLALRVEFDPALNSHQVYPLLFLPLVENAFKFIGGEYKMAISARLLDNEILFQVENSILQFDVPVKKVGGIGLDNLQRRLDLLYPGKHSLTATNTNGIYIAELRVQHE